MSKFFTVMISFAHIACRGEPRFFPLTICNRNIASHDSAFQQRVNHEGIRGSLAKGCFLNRYLQPNARSMSLESWKMPPFFVFSRFSNFISEKNLTKGRDRSSRHTLSWTVQDLEFEIPTSGLPTDNPRTIGNVRVTLPAHARTHSVSLPEAFGI